jgi:hypothetical protein
MLTAIRDTPLSTSNSVIIILLILHTHTKMYIHTNSIHDADGNATDAVASPLEHAG